MTEDKEAAEALKDRLRIKRWAHRNFAVSVAASVLLLIWYTCNPSLDYHQWPQTMALILIAGSFLFYIPSFAESGGRFIHYCILASALVPDLYGYLFDDQSTFLGTGPWWPLIGYFSAVIYFTPGAILGAIEIFFDQLTDN
jgi:hypothetical protein